MAVMAEGMAPATIGHDTVVARRDRVLMAEIDGETVLMSVERGSYFSLTDTARAIWHRLEHPIAVKALCAALADAYAGDPHVIEVDVINFLDRLAEVDLIALT